jgi:alpha-L-arabinofuranosidase
MERGHSEPFGVKYWSVGNEVYGKWMYPNPYTADTYAETVRKYSIAMRRIDPSVVVIAAGLDPAWDRTLVQRAGGYFDWLARHEYPPESAAFTGEHGAREYVRQVKRPEEFIRPWLEEARREMDSLGDAGKRVGLSFDEWNVWHKWFTKPDSFEWHVGPTEGAFLAALLNMFCREASTLNLRKAALFQPINEGAISVSPFSADLTAMGQIFSLYRMHHGGRLLPTPRPRAGDPLDTCATLSSDGSTVHVTIINREASPCSLQLSLTGRAVEGASWTLLSVAHLQADVPFDSQHRNLAVDADQKIRALLPPFGVAGIDVRLGK